MGRKIMGRNRQSDPDYNRQYRRRWSEKSDDIPPDLSPRDAQAQRDAEARRRLRLPPAPTS